MKTYPSEPTRSLLSPSSLVSFVCITFGLAWGIIAPYIFCSDLMSDTFGPLTGDHPLFYLAVYAPAIAALTLVFQDGGIWALGQLFRRMLLRRCSTGWMVFLVAGIPAVFYAGAAWKGTLFVDPFPFEDLDAMVFALLMGLIKGPVEELGWRGFMLPLLQQKMAPIWASIGIGLIWGIWHLPAFLLSGTQQSTWAFTPFLLGTVMISIIMTALYNHSKGSILLAAFMHCQLMNPVWPDAQPFDSYLLAVVAVVVLWKEREEMFGKSESVETVF